VARHEIDYLAPLVWHPRGIDVEVWVAALGGASIDVAYVVRDEERTYARARSTLVAYDFATGRPRRLTPDERAFLGAFSAS
jgi:acyl-CoA thioester hydrolase